MCPAIHISSRSWLRSSSTHEPSDPPLRVVHLSVFFEADQHTRTSGTDRGDQKKGVGGETPDGRLLPPVEGWKEVFKPTAPPAGGGPTGTRRGCDSRHSFFHRRGFRARRGGPEASGFFRSWDCVWARRPVMILPQVHLRKPCYDFYYL